MWQKTLWFRFLLSDVQPIRKAIRKKEWEVRIAEDIFCLLFSVNAPRMLIPGDWRQENKEGFNPCNAYCYPHLMVG